MEHRSMNEVVADTTAAAIVDLSLDDLDLDFEDEATEEVVEKQTEPAVVEFTNDALEAIDEIEEIEELDEVPAEDESQVEDALAALDDLELPDEVEAAIELEETKRAAYAEMEDSAEVAPPPPVAASPISETAKSPSRSSAKSSRSGPVVRDLSALPAEIFVRTIGADPDDEKAWALGNRPGQIKVAEKFENLFISLNRGIAPSRYVDLAYRHLKSRGKLSNKELVAFYMDQGLREGTARSQAGQLMNLLRHVKVMDSAGNLNPDSAIAVKLDKVLGL